MRSAAVSAKNQTPEQKAEIKRLFMLDKTKRVNAVCSRCRIRRHVPSAIYCMPCMETLA